MNRTLAVIAIVIAIPTLAAADSGSIEFEMVWDTADADFTDVACKIQIQTPTEDVVAGKQQFRRRFKIYLAREINVSIGDLLRDQSLNLYDIITWFSRERIDELSIIEAEFKD